MSMKLLDLIYYLSYKAYLRNDNRKSGLFFLLSCWVTLFQTLMVYILIFTHEIFTKTEYSENIGKKEHAILLLSILGLNNIYLNFGNRMQKILSRFSYYDEKREKFHWYLLIAIYFGAFITFSLLAAFRKSFFIEC